VGTAFEACLGSVCGGDPEDLAGIMLEAVDHIAVAMNRGLRAACTARSV